MKASRYSGKDKKTNRRSLLPESNHSPLSRFSILTPSYSPSVSPSAYRPPTLSISLNSAPLAPDSTADGTNNGVKFIRLHIGTIKRQTDRQPNERANGQAVRQHKGRINFKYHILVPT